MEQGDSEVLEYIRSHLCVDWEDIRKAFDELLRVHEHNIKRIDSLERRLIKYEKVRISNASEDDIRSAGGFVDWMHAEDGLTFHQEDDL